MLIDWFTVGAQIVNFGILVLILRAFLYKRILAAIQAREESIAQKQQQAEELQQQARQEQARYEEQSRELERSREEVLVEMREEVATQRDNLLRQARTEIDKLRETWHQGLRENAETFLAELTQRITSEIFAMTTKMLADLADATLQERLVEVFIQRLASLSPEQSQELRQALPRLTKPVSIRSSQVLPDSLKSRLQEELKQIGYEREMHFEVDDYLLCGIELRAGGIVVAWDMGEQLRSLESSLSSVIKRELATAREAKPVARKAE